MRIKKVNYNEKTMSGTGLVVDFYKITEEFSDHFKVVLDVSDGDLALNTHDTIIWKKQIGKKNHICSIELID
tara:strand:+ start:373 stop:588 length:216 start_codon:yes stop_codon:yes gene_type:complete